MNPFQTHRLPGQTGKHALPARGMVICLKALLFLILLPALALGQGLVNVDIRNLGQQAWVLDPSGSPLKGTNFLALILYGSDPASLYYHLGDPMPFRVSFTTSPGTWNPGAQRLRGLQGFAEGQTVMMRVVAWDGGDTSDWSEARDLATNAGKIAYGESQVFAYRVGAPSDPNSLILSNFPGLRMTRGACVSSGCLPPPPACYNNGPDIMVELNWNGGETNISLYPQLSAYRGTDRRSGLLPLTPDTPVWALLPDSGLTTEAARLYEVSGTVGSTHFKIVSNRLGDSSVPLSRQVGYGSYFRTPGPGRACGLLPGFLRVRIRPVEQIPVFRISRASPGSVRIQFSGTPLKPYVIEQSTILPRFLPLATNLTGEDGIGPPVVLPLTPLSAPRRYFQLVPAP